MQLKPSRLTLSTPRPYSPAWPWTVAQYLHALPLARANIPWSTVVKRPRIWPAAHRGKRRSSGVEAGELRAHVPEQLLAFFVLRDA